MHQSVPLKAASAQPRSLCVSRLGHHQVHEAITASVGATEGPRRASTPSLMMPRRKEPLDQARHTRGTTPSSNNNSSSLPRRGDQNHQHSTFAASSKQILDALGGGCDDAYRGAHVLELRQWLLQRLSSSLSVSMMDNSSIRVHPAVAVGDDGRDSAPVAATQRRLTDAGASVLVRLAEGTKTTTVPSEAAAATEEGGSSDDTLVPTSVTHVVQLANSALAFVSRTTRRSRRRSTRPFRSTR